MLYNWQYFSTQIVVPIVVVVVVAAVTILLRFSCFATDVDANSGECLTFSFIAQSFAIIFYLLGTLLLLLLLLFASSGIPTAVCAVWCLVSRVRTAASFYCLK